MNYSALQKNIKPFTSTLTEITGRELTVTIILPAFNEEKTIEKTIRDFNSHLPEASILVINNNSTDKTFEIAYKVIDELKIANSSVIHESRQGKGFAVRRGFLEVDSDIVVIADADTTYPASAIKTLINPIINGECDITIGDRFSNGSYAEKNNRPFHQLGNRLVTIIINRLFNENLTDIMTGYRAFSKRYVKTFPVLTKGFEIETEMTLHTLDKRIAFKEIPIDYSTRPEGSFSKLCTYKDGLKVIATIFQIFRLYKPFLFFSSISTILFLLSMSAGLPVINEYLATGAVLGIPKAILATGLMMLSGLMFTVALILDSIVRIHRFNYELKLLENIPKQ